MSCAAKLEDLITNTLIPDINERLDEIFELISDSKNASDEDKEEIEELQDFKDDLNDLLVELQAGEVSDEECQEIYNEILEAQQDEDEE